MNNPSSIRAWFRRVLVLATAAMLPTAASADILLVSQNTLHLGWGNQNYQAGKNAFIQTLASWPNTGVPQLTMLQEVMSQASQNAIQPIGGLVHFGNLKGATARYLERYGFVAVNNPQNHLHIFCSVDTTPLVSTGFTMSRPPDATLVGDSSNNQQRVAWILNFHAVFGRTVGGRQAEVSEIGRIIARLSAVVPTGCPGTTSNVIAVGDWNLPATDPAFQALGQNAGFAQLNVAPNVATSLNPQGVPSSAYDHFVWDGARVQVSQVNLAAAQNACQTQVAIAASVLNAASLLNFRQNCSDHLGIAAIVRIF